ncbi:YL1 nuclear protein-domain-containing protein [Massariosphaeria phaeospora]|uniref:YL1 nuclear protein-domain-containing protein n=1 Tax=Massariosphaeria phaeospora TaxID=100035 RepID=A0A7C8MH66_9PLEO|nr:YL1 nuclear protein-domain-containing protein [Massariosphaeria phaeospora]
MSLEPAERMDIDTLPDQDGDPSGSVSGEGESEAEAPVDLMVVSRARRSNAGNRMSTLLAQSAEAEEWGEEWEEAPDEEDFQGDDANNQDDFNMDSSSSEEDDEGGEDEAGEKELRKVERQERIKNRRPATNPFAARLAAARKKVKLDVPSTRSPTGPASRPKKKSERASWIPTEDDGPVRTSSRRQTMANKEHTMAKLKEKDKRRDNTLAMMKAAEARKAKDEPKAMTQAERLAEAARVERVNSKSLHRWEVAEEQRAGERQAMLDALKNRQIDGPFIRYYSGPAIYVDDKLKYTGKDAPKLEHLEEKLNKDTLATSESQPAHSRAVQQTEALESVIPTDQLAADEQAGMHQTHSQSPFSPSQTTPSQVPQAQHTPGSSSIEVQENYLGSHDIPYPSSIMFAPPQNPDSFLFGIEQYATPQQTHSQPTNFPLTHTPQSEPHHAFAPQLRPTNDFPYNPFSTSSNPPQTDFPQNPFSTHPSLADPLLSHTDPSSQSLLSQFQKPAAPPAPPRRKAIRRALRNLLILTSFPHLDAAPPPAKSSRGTTTAATLKDKDRSALIQLSAALFKWSAADAAAYLAAMLAAPKTAKAREKEASLKAKREMCAVTNLLARYKDPETGIAYRDARAFGVLRGVVGGGFVWSGDLGCYVGGRAKPVDRPDAAKSRGFLGMVPATGVPRRFSEMPKPMPPPPTPKAVPALGGLDGANGGENADGEGVKMEDVVAG